MVGALARPAETRRLQHGRLSRRGGRGSARGIDLQIPLPQRRKPRRARTAAAAGIFLRLGLAAGSGAASSRLRRTVAQPRDKGRGAAQRHPSESRRHRTDAHPGRPAQFPLGRGLEDHGRDAVLHQPHAAAGGAGDLAGRTVRAAVAAASRHHLPHQCRASGAGGRTLPRRRRFPRLGVADRREIRPQGADGTTRIRRLAPHQRRLGDAFRSDEGDRVRGSQSSLSRPHHQQDQRHHLPPLADAGQSEADRSAAPGLRRSRARRSRATAAPRGAAPATTRSSSNSATSSTTTSWRWRG